MRLSSLFSPIKAFAERVIDTVATAFGRPPKSREELATPPPPPKITPASFAQSVGGPVKLGPLVALANAKEPVALAAMTAGQRTALRATLPPATVRVLEAQLHPGLAENPFDFRKLAGSCTPEIDRALAAYLSRDFAFVDLDEKREVLVALQPVLLPKKLADLVTFHLPRPMVNSDRAHPVTLAIEAEAGIVGRPQTLDYYAPNPEGRLDPRVMTKALLRTLEAKGLLTPRPPLWQRLPAEERASRLQWKDLTHQGRLAYMQSLMANVDPSASLFRITKLEASPVGALAPATLRDQVKWEVSGPMKTAELITKSHYTSFDQICRDQSFIAGIGGSPPGFHYHCVFDLETRKDKEELGPKLVGLAAMTDLLLFAHGAGKGANLLDHRHLEVFTGEGVFEAMSAFGKEIDGDDILVHKYHLVGVRHGEGMYGNKNRLGLEIRAVLTSEPEKGPQVLARTLDIATSRALRKVDTEFWLNWNAGDKALPDAAYARAKAACKDAQLASDAKLSFEEVFEYAMSDRGSKSTFRLAAPLWSYETLPGMTAAEQARVQQARARYETKMLELSASLTTAIESGRDIPPKTVFAEISRTVAVFFNEAKVAPVIDRHLNTLRGES